MNGGAAGQAPEDGFRSPIAEAPAAFVLLYCLAYIAFRHEAGLGGGLAAALAVSICAACLLIGTAVINKGFARAAFAALLLCAAATARFEAELAPLTEPGAWKFAPYREEGAICEVTSVRRWGFITAASARLEDGSGSLALIFGRGRGLGMPDIAPGDLLSVSGRVSPFTRPEGGGFDELLYWRSRGCFGRLEVAKYERVGTARTFARLRTILSKRMEEALPPRTAGYMRAFITGERDEALASLHRAGGTAHLLAVSGFHVAAVAGIGYLAFGRLRRFRLRWYLISALVWAYTALSGAAPSALRAAFMIQFAIAGRFFGRGGRPFNTACAAGAALLAIDPWLFWDIGWRLSMTAVLAAVSAASLFRGFMPRLFAGCALVWLAASVPQAAIFGPVPLAGAVLNLFALPAFGVIIPVSVVLSAPALMGSPIGPALAEAPEAAFRAWERLAGNVIYLVPAEVATSIGLVCGASCACGYFFALASGFGAARAGVMSAAALAIAAAITLL